MAKDTDGLLLSASLDIDGTYKKIKEEDITKLNAKLANDNSARVKIVGGLDLNKTQSLIQSQIATISKSLKLDISGIDTNSLNTTLSNVQNKIIGTNNGLTIKPTVDGKIIEDTDTLIKAVVGKLQQLNNIDLKTFKDNLKNIFGVSSKEISDDATSLINNLRLKPEDTAAIIQDYNNLIESIRNTFISKGMGNITDGMNFENNVVTSIYKAATNIKAANEQVEQSNQSIINSEQRVAEILTSTNTQVLSFKQSLQSIGMNDDSINSVINRIEKLNVEVTSLNQSLSTTAGKNGKSILNVEVSGVDKLGQAVKFTQQLDLETGNLIKQIDSVATASTKSASQLDDLMAQQIKRRAELTNQVNQIYNSAIDPNATRSITDSSKLDELNRQYDAVNSAIEKMSGTTKTAFAESEAEVTKLITKLKSTVQEYKNAENVSTALKPDKLTSAVSKLESEFATLNTKAENANVTSEKLKTNLDEIETILNKPKNGEVINKAEIEQAFTALSSAKSELNALISAKTSNSAIEKVRIQAETLSDELNTFASKNTGFNTFEQTINGTIVSVTSLKNALKGVTSAADLSIIKAQISALKSAFNSSNNDIKKYTNLIDKATSKLNNLQNDSTFLKNSSNPQVVEAKKQIADLITEYQTLKNTLQGDLTPDGIQNAITRFDELDKQFKQVTTSANTLKTSISASDTISKQAQQTELLSSKIKKLIAEINTYKNANSKMMSSNKLTSNGNTFAQELENMLLQLSHCANTEDFQKIAANFRGIKAEAKELGIEGGTIFTTLWEKLKKFSSWMSMTSVVSSVVMDIRNAIVELKEIDTILTEISKTSDLTTEALAKLGKTSFDSASKYGKKASDYLVGVQEMYRAGFQNAPEMSELSILAQAAGDLSSDAANDYLIATDAAYSFKGSIEKLNAVLDSQNYITNNAAVAMQDMADATSEAASVAAQYGVDIDELSALIAVAVSKTRESGSEVGNALKSIFINLQDTTSKPIQDAFASVDISMTKLVNGSEKLKTPIELIKELSKAFTSLEEGDTRRANILSDIGGRLYHNVQKCA